MLTAARDTRRADRTALVATVLVAAAAWGALVAWDASPWSRYLDHDGLDAASLGPAPTIAVFVGGWALMLSATMLPTTRPLVGLFSRVVARRDDGRRLVAVLLAGYLAVWVVVGLLAYAGDVVLHALIDGEAWGVSAGVLAVAGAYQLSPLKESCLTQCRSPRLQIMGGWHGRHPVAEAFTLGAEHGRTCVGCCWALMLVMFGIGAGSLGWMLALASVMTVEKTWRRGAMLRVPIGAVLLGASAATGVAQL